MAHDSEYFRCRAAEARAAAFLKHEGDGAAVAGDLALAYAALARRQAEIATRSEQVVEDVPFIAAD